MNSSSGELNQIVLSRLTQIKEQIKDVNLIESPHLSLSKTFILKHHWIENFVKTLNEKITTSSEEMFLVFDCSQILFLSNEDNTRHFACLPVDEQIHLMLKSLIKKVDSCLKEFNLPTYYADPKFHISILWKLSEFTEDEKCEILNRIKSIKDKLEYSVDKINLKTGNKLFSINL